ARTTAPRFRPRIEVLEGRDVPSTLTVTNNLDDASVPVGSLRYELANAQNGDTIAFDSNSLKGQTITLTSGELLVNKSLNIQGLGASQLAISAGFNSRVLEVAYNVQVTLSGLTIRDGSAAGDPSASWVGYVGGGIVNFGTLTISNSTISGNFA